MRSVRVALVALLALIGLVAVGLGVSALVRTEETDQRQRALEPFYTPPYPLPITPGTLLRSEPLGVGVPGGTAHRILYVSQTADGVAAASGGMIVVPSTPAPPGGRPVVAWAHGTLGQGDACAPSRSANPLQDTGNWLDQMMRLGWVVVSTDYVGLGTPGTDRYLVAQAEARDVVNAVRAAREFESAEAGTRWVVWGHSQGGHAALWTGHLAGDLAPELTLLGAAAAAPAAELLPIMEAQWDTVVGWVIGPEVAVSWPTAAPRVSLDGVLSDAGRDNYRRLAEECVTPAAIEGLIRSDLGERFFAVDPTTRPDWAAAARAETVPAMPASMPVYLAQGTADTVVLPQPNALLQRRWCAAGSALTVLWMGGVSHQAAATTAGPDAVAWMADRFADRPAGRTCDTPVPVGTTVP
jgi:alpha-beta hydrolase superfamily lysophospholipase